MSQPLRNDGLVSVMAVGTRGNARMSDGTPPGRVWKKIGHAPCTGCRRYHAVYIDPDDYRSMKRNGRLAHKAVLARTARHRVPTHGLSGNDRPICHGAPAMWHFTLRWINERRCPSTTIIRPTLGQDSLGSFILVDVQNNPTHESAAAPR